MMPETQALGKGGVTPVAMLVLRADVKPKTEYLEANTQHLKGC